MANVSGKIVMNFTLEEMACKDGTLVLTPDAADHARRLQMFRLWYNRSMPVNSWYRSLAYNRTIKDSSDSSRHILGIATDIALPSDFHLWTPARRTGFITNVKNKWYELCAKDGLGGGFGLYNTFIHFDSRPVKAYWDLRKG